MNFRDYEKYTINEEHRRMFQLMGQTPQPLNEQRSKYKQGRNKVKVKPGKGDKDYKLVVTKGTNGNGLKYNPSSKNLIPVYDMNKGFRMLDIDGLTELKIDKETYEIE